MPLLATVLLASATTRPLVLAHYLPWYASRTVSGAWGWHWTMNRYNPDQGELASPFRPLLGPYDSSDPDLVACHALLMRMTGVGGIALDWYGDLPRYDYALIHRNARLTARIARRAGLKVALVYEDATVPHLVTGGQIQPGQEVAAARRLLFRAQTDWFRASNYLRWRGRPVLMVFGPQFYREADWRTILDGLYPLPVLLSLHHRRDGAEGPFDWPLPQRGEEGAQEHRAAFNQAVGGAVLSVPTAYPRFQDIYAQAGVRPSYGALPDQDGATFRRTLADALATRAPFVQIATWNDWGEGTQIEPSEEFGYRDLEALQRALKPPGVTRADLRLPVRLYRLQKAHRGDRPALARLQRISNWLFARRYARARAALDRFPAP